MKRASRCIEELRGKVRYFEKSGLIPTLDGPGNKILKLDSLIDKSLHRDLNRACYTLLKDQGGNADWHPRSNDMVQNLIHPSMYNFVYDRSPFIQEEVVGVSNALNFMDEGKPVRGQSPVVRQNVFEHEWEPEFATGSGKIGSEYWSDKYQWLPANVRFREDGSTEFKSYVNNLHPTRFPEIYRTIESDENDDSRTPEFSVKDFLHKDVELTHQELRDLEEECYHESEDPVEFDEDEDQRRMNEGLPPLTPNVDDETMAESLREKFKKDGLQIIVKIASIELTPEKPEFSAGSWHLEGQMNEKIAATALQHRVSSFKLQDPTKPGHRRFIALWIVNPHRRILSTANVPPQQKDWWTGSGEMSSGLVDVEEAPEHRLKFMDERTAEKARAHWESIDYNFCEH
ncbi:hypothetical protein F25303_3571 [Fusarium sp. NRRL 25303]|nr:hypothetical protein F25303_3571 [Fusarium sp. NRRL 25303]